MAEERIKEIIRQYEDLKKESTGFTKKERKATLGEVQLRPVNSA